ncbi:Type III restriction enzyme, res subunit [Thermincola ferriacetica]|uniref:Type III restriction enzyme, res subunit n=1 Tax=Thermincola ferriacetica TaxID=281456 RepID=A0A0L6W4A8_9FIRM|nr:DEAD/DEAH box helicase family protein [Thermincola ferriacetica]KNZ70223.1 Type III restriction enzyme, res subunit [Thermincola ferriacetica]
MPRTTRRTTSPGNQTVPFNRRLVLNRYMLSLFEVSNFDDLVAGMKGPELEWLDSDNVSHYCHYLTNRLFDREKLTADMLRRYDENIVRHTMHINRRRKEPVRWKYFQYLSLLFTEIYLDRYFSDPEGLLEDLNAFVEKFNEQENAGIEKYTAADLKKLAYWNATGSGKTLLMHVNILQYLHYLKQHGREKELNQVILLTPKEDLSVQHLREFELSGIEAELFDKNQGSLFRKQSVSIINIQRIREESGEKTVAVEVFEGNNLVLVDEGHRGSSGEEWKKMRDRLSEQGFAFEYSATFGQAVAGNRALQQEYARCILFDYSYRYFYNDGYGKDFHILNLPDDSNEDVRRLYLTACLLTFYQQLKLYGERESALRPFLLEKPLLVFVGSSVNAVRTERGRKVSDVTDILLFIARFAREEKESVEIIKRLMSGRPGLLDEKGREIFRNAFTYLTSLAMTPEALYSDLLQTVFHATHSGATLHVVNLKGVDSEIALRLGDNPPFGVINVGDTSALCKLCDNYSELNVTEEQFSESLFHRLNNRDSKINVLIGSKKFTEGWSSWRVSTMGLMNIGRSEGSEIIQMFGRGVRLKGYGMSLKRSGALQLDIKKPAHIDVLETLNIFGVRSDYMQQFRDILESEGIKTEKDTEIIKLPVIKDYTRRGLKLKTLDLKDIDINSFKKKGPRPVLEPPAPGMKIGHVMVNWYPRIQRAESRKKATAQAAPEVMNEGKLEARHVAFMNLERIYFELQKFKNERAWYNLSLSREKIKELLYRQDWYILYIPEEELQFGSRFSRVRNWEEIAVALLKKYCERYYMYRKKEWEAPFMEYRDLNEADRNFIHEYRVTYDVAETTLKEKLEYLKQLLESRKMEHFYFAGLELFEFEQHLYKPLAYQEGSVATVSPAPLNKGEYQFVTDLRAFCETNREFFKDKELYLLRNQTRGKGVGFFEAGNFFPDFILWILYNGKQYITFVDPKGIRNMSIDDPKIQFHKTIKEKEKEIGDSSIVLNSFIISNTEYANLINTGTKLSKEEMEKRNILFQADDRASYIEKMVRKILG